MFEMATSRNPLDRSRSAIAILALAIGVLILPGCSASDEQLSADSTCEDYLSQPSEVRHDAAVRISSDLDVEESGNPMWGASLDAACGGNPSKTLGELFRHE